MGLVEPWTVTDVNLDIKALRVDVWVDHPSGLRWRCPKCGEESSLHDHSDERVWRHLDSCQFKTYLHARPPRLKCPRHGVRQARLSWAEPNSRFTALFERLAIDVLKETDVEGATRLLGLSWDEAWAIKRRAVERGLKRKKKRAVPLIGVDEKAFRKGHRYVTVVCDLERGTVEHVEKDRKKASLDAYFAGMSPRRRERIRAVAMDMWEPYVASVVEHVPGAETKIVFDRFHAMKHVNEAVDKVRKQEHRALGKEGKETLKGTKYLWLRGGENVAEDDLDRFEALKKANLRTGRAWAIKESLRGLWSYRRAGWARRHWEKWYGWAMRSRLGPMMRAARTLKGHLANIMTYFEHRITNAVSEGINSTIQRIKQRARGFRNLENFKTSIYFHCGGLSLYPQSHGNPG